MKTEYTFKIDGKISGCFSCPFHFDDGDIHCVLKKGVICLISKRPSNCPLKVVPTHGRLIDADKLTDTIVRCINDSEKEYPKEDFELVKMVYESCLYHIVKAPSILEERKK